MYVVATCGAFVVGVKFDAGYIALDDIKKEFAKQCQELFGLRDSEVENVRVESVCNTASIVTALIFMDKFTDECSKVIRKKMSNALKASIMAVYAKVYEREMMRKVDALRNQLSIY